MAHCRPTRITNHGEARHLSQAVGAFIVELTEDRRVQDYYDTWHGARRRAEQDFEGVLAAHPHGIPTTLVDWCMADRDTRDQAVTSAFLRTTLQMPERWLAIVTAELRCAFLAVYTHRRLPPDQRPDVPLYGLGVQLQRGHARGKVPTTPDVVQRHMRVLYRHKHADPRVSLRTLAREYQAAGGRTFEVCLREVTRGLGQAEGWLDLAAGAAWKHGRIVLPMPDSSVDMKKMKSDNSP